MAGRRRACAAARGIARFRSSSWQTRGCLGHFEGAGITSDWLFQLPLMLTPQDVLVGVANLLCPERRPGPNWPATTSEAAYLSDGRLPAPSCRKIALAARAGLGSACPWKDYSARSAFVRAAVQLDVSSFWMLPG
jgi:hypothetical protein